jgi:hypothetical protein
VKGIPKTQNPEPKTQNPNYEDNLHRQELCQAYRGIKKRKTVGTSDFSEARFGGFVETTPFCHSRIFK